MAGGSSKEAQEDAGGVGLPWGKVYQESEGRPRGPDARLKLLLGF